jgi:hypothetical protein
MSEGGFAFLVWAFLIALVLIGGMVAAFAVVAVAAGRRPRPKPRGPFPPERVELLRRTAGALGGEVVDLPAKYAWPFVRVGGEARYAVILATPDESLSGPYNVVFEAPVPGRSFVEAWPQRSRFQPLRVTSGAAEVTLGDPAFDREYIVRADDAAHARAVLSPELRGAMAKMRGLGGGGLVRFDLHPFKAVVQKEEALAHPEELRRFALDCLDLLRDLKGSLEMQSGIEFHDGAPKRPAAAQCPVCQSGIERGRVACRRCKTPHHEECWKYFGACSMFACGEKGYELA